MSRRREFRSTSQAEVERAFIEGRLERRGSLVCLRRSLPGWWTALADENKGPRLEHAPIPPLEALTARARCGTSSSADCRGCPTP
jgi:hypothetical protein